ncbi:rhodanese-like domain-containing protein [Sphingobacterium suaedae]|uniref:Rhodanese-like domain-containing protein n=1 Tax=Sphingobacterium suaedae TaxID=1686402 RepID=A0ABW5KCV9_9SPHI
MFFQQIYDKTLAQASYFVGCQAKNEAVVIDAKRDVDTYLEIAKQNNMRITHVVETHIHADFLAGTRELSALTGAEIYLSDEGGDDWQYAFDHQGLREGDRIRVGNLSLEVLHTPGHTPESISLLLRDHPASDEPVMIFTGDFVFVGDIGRPDLLEQAAGIVGTKEIGAVQMFASLKKFRKLPDFVQVWPGHGAGSACGKSLGSVPSSTVGYEKIRNWAFQFDNDFDGFQRYLLQDQPDVPTYFAQMKKRNKEDRKLLLTVPEHPTLDAVAALKDAGLTWVDARHKSKFAAGHVPGSWNIQHNQAMANWAGWMLSYDDRLVIVAPEEEQQEITRKLMRIGMDQIAGFLTDLTGVDRIASHVVDADDVERLKGRDDVVLLDVRSRREYQEAHIPGARHHFVGDLPSLNLAEIMDKHVVIQCQSGDRATIAYSFLERNGINRLSIYLGSFQDWKTLEKAVVTGE